jgi:hypothetical protein
MLKLFDVLLMSKLSLLDFILQMNVLLLDLSYSSFVGCTLMSKPIVLL